jgi:hypothetical protein
LSKNEKYKDWIQKVNDYTLRCVFCNIEFTNLKEFLPFLNMKKQQIIRNAVNPICDQLKNGTNKLEKKFFR